MYSQFCVDAEFVSDLFGTIKSERIYKEVSEWNEENRDLPKELTPKPGFYDYNYTSYLKEIVNNFSPFSPIQETAFLKPSQIGATTGVLEAIIAYYIGCVPKPILFVSADEKNVEKGMEIKIERLIDGCDLRHLIKPQTGVKTKKTGDRKTEKEYPGGFLHGVGAGNPANLRAMNYPILVFDEVDGMPLKIKNEGSPIELALNRCIVPYERNGKVLYISTPLILQTSQIWKKYLEGDQRHFNVPCLHCEESIVLHTHLRESETKTGLKGGIIFDLTESGKLIPQSVKYKCQLCGGEMIDDNKSIMLPEGYWEPTAEPAHDRIRSYWLNSLYSPPGMFSWIGYVKSLLKCYDPIKNRVTDIEAYRSHRNTKEGKPFEESGEAPKYERIIQHQRPYPVNLVPNKLCQEDNGHPILMLFAAVDVQRTCLYLDIKGFTVGGRSYTIDFREIPGDTTDFEDPCWNALADIIEHEIWTADDGKKYKILTTMIDARWNTENVYRFCAQYHLGVYAQHGERTLPGQLTFVEASKATIKKADCLVFKTNTGKLKDRIAAAFRKDWNSGDKMQPEWRPNFPDNLQSDYFKHFEAEYKVLDVDPKTGKKIGFFWKLKDHRTPNHGFDTFVYCLLALEQFAESVCVAEKYDEYGNETGLELDALNWPAFWEFAIKKQYFS